MFILILVFLIVVLLVVLVIDLLRVSVLMDVIVISILMMLVGWCWLCGFWVVIIVLLFRFVIS